EKKKSVHGWNNIGLNTTFTTFFEPLYTYNKIYHIPKDKDYTLKNLSVNIGKSGKRGILNLLKENKELSSEEMMAKLNISYGELYPILLNLKESGDIFEIKPDRFRLLE
ncbi:unnamed protein product, partial [marine sediment metagenome]